MHELPQSHHTAHAPLVTLHAACASVQCDVVAIDCSTTMTHSLQQLINCCLFAAENETSKKGALAYDYILAPSKGDTPKKVMTPPRQRPVSLEIIDMKMKSAQLRRHVRWFH